jgi:hypothetical protein
VTPLEVTADHVKLYKRALLEAGLKRGVTEFLAESVTYFLWVLL